MNQSDYQKLLLGGTVAVPACAGTISFLNIGTTTHPQLVVQSEESISPDASIVRTFRFEDVRALYLVESCELFTQGTKLTELANCYLANGDVLCGILYMPHQAPGLFEMKAGVTAASSLNLSAYIKRSGGKSTAANPTSLLYPGDPVGGEQGVPMPDLFCAMNPHDPDPCPDHPPAGGGSGGSGGLPGGGYMSDVLCAMNPHDPDPCPDPPLPPQPGNGGGSGLPGGG